MMDLLVNNLEKCIAKYLLKLTNKTTQNDGKSHEFGSFFCFSSTNQLYLYLKTF